MLRKFEFFYFYFYGKMSRTSLLEMNEYFNFSSYIYKSLLKTGRVSVNQNTPKQNINHFALF